MPSYPDRSFESPYPPDRAVRGGVAGGVAFVAVNVMHGSLAFVAAKVMHGSLVPVAAKVACGSLVPAAPPRTCPRGLAALPRPCHRVLRVP